MLLDLLSKGAKPILFNPPAPGEVMAKDVPKARDNQGNEFVDQNSEWIIIGYQFNAGLPLPAVATTIQPAGSFFIEDGQGGNQKSPVHFFSSVYSSPLVECYFPMGKGKPIFINCNQAISLVLYVWDPNYSNSRRTNF